MFSSREAGPVQEEVEQAGSRDGRQRGGVDTQAGSGRTSPAAAPGQRHQPHQRRLLGPRRSEAGRRWHAGGRLGCRETIQVAVLSIPTSEDARSVANTSWRYAGHRFAAYAHYRKFFYAVFRSNPPSRPNNVCVKCPSARPYVRPSTKSFFDFNEIW